MSTDTTALKTTGTPISSEVITVPCEWIDHYGHMTSARYFEAFVDIGYGLLEKIGFDENYVKGQQRGVFLVDAHMQYLRELHQGDRFRIQLTIQNIDEKRLYLLLEMIDEDRGHVSARVKEIALHVDLATRKVIPFSPEMRAHLQRIVEQHATDGPQM